MATRAFSSARLLVCAGVAGLVATAGGSLGASRATAVPDHADARTVAHVLNRLGYGARPGDVERVQQMGLAAYIEQQLHPERIPDDAVDAQLAQYATLTMSAKDVATKIMQPAQQARREMQVKEGRAAQQGDQTMAAPTGRATPPQQTPELRMLQQNQQRVANELMAQKIIRAEASDRQLNEVLVDFWFNHFNVFVGKGEQERTFLTSYERDVIRPHVLGSFRDLLGAVAHSPAMLFYLDNWESVDPNSPDKQLATLEAQVAHIQNPMQRLLRQQQLNQRKQQMEKQGRRGLNENYGRELMELHTLGVDGGYTQKDVVEVARALTGWTINMPGGGPSPGGSPNWEFLYRPLAHDAGAKVILGVTFPAGHGEDEGERVLDLLAAQPATAHHIAYELAQRFVADEPPSVLVDRAAKTFLETKGDLREVTRVIITSPEFFAASDVGAKLKTPLDFVVSAVRASGAVVDNPQPLVQALRNLGMPLYGCIPPTGYSTTADAWVNTGALLARMNLALQIVSNQMRGVRVDLATLAPSTTDDARKRLVESILGDTISDTTAQTLARAQNPQLLVALTLGSPEFQRH